MPIHSSDYEDFEGASAEHRRLLRQEALIVEVTEALAEALSARGINQSQLARRLNKTKGYISQLLGGGRNLTLRTLADVADALDCLVEFTLHSQSTMIGTDRAWPNMRDLSGISNEIEACSNYRIGHTDQMDGLAA